MTSASAVMARPAAAIILPRLRALVSAHPGCAAFAVATASATSAAPEAAAEASTRICAGSKTSSTAAAEVSAPPMKLRSARTASQSSAVVASSGRWGMVMILSMMPLCRGAAEPIGPADGIGGFQRSQTPETTDFLGPAPKNTA